MTSSLQEFQEKFRTADLEVLRMEHWTWSVRPAPSTLGAGVLSLNRFAESFGDLTREESSALAEAVRRVESALTRFSAPDRFNYLMLMMVDSHVHFHVIPRYAAERQAAGMDWVDSGWPALPSLNDNADRKDSPALIEIRDALREAAGLTPGP